MKFTVKKLFSICLSSMMAISFMPRTVLAADLYEDFTVNGITYRVTGEKEVAVASASKLTETEVKIPETVQKLDSDLTYTVTSIKESVFESSKIKSVSIPASIQTIGDSAFGSCKSLDNVSFYGDHKGLLEIGEYAFNNCTSLQTIDLPDNLEIISGSTFFGCTSLKSVHFPQNLKKIENMAFFGCRSLESIELPEGLEQIDTYAFSLGTNQVLKYINIPSTVTTLGESFLVGGKTDGTTALVFQGKTPPANMNENALDGLPGQNQPTLYFPADAAKAYTHPDSLFVKAGLVEANSNLQGYALDLPESFHICPGKTEKFPGTISAPRGVTLSWTSSDPKVATVDESDKLEGLSNGTATITATISIQGIEQVSDSCKVKVSHTYTWVIDKEPTKDQPGLKYQYCEDCHHKTNYISIPAIGYTEQVESAVYRAYNPNNGEHLYTTNYDEFIYITNRGWKDEGVSFMTELETEGHPVYRVYNPNSGLHHYTTDENEKTVLVSLGWKDEGVSWYSSKKPQAAPVYRVYNPNGGQHHYTMNKQEKDVLVSYGWHDEGIAFRTASVETK